MLTKKSKKIIHMEKLKNSIETRIIKIEGILIPKIDKIINNEKKKSKKNINIILVESITKKNNYINELEFLNSKLDQLKQKYG